MANSAWDWSTTAASNNSATPYGWPENQNASTVNDCARQMMATLTEAIHSTTAGGTADALTVTLANAPAALTDNMEILVRAAAANTTTTPTLNLNSLGAKTITKLGGAALTAGDLVGNLYEMTLRYNLANTRWELLNPPPIGFIADATNGGINVSSTGGTATLNIKPSDLLTKASPTSSDSFMIMDAAASSAAKTATIPSIFAGLATKAAPTTSDSVVIIDVAASSVGKTATLANLFKQSLGTSGYIVLPGGFTVQWGAISVNSGGGFPVTFPRTFAATPYAVLTGRGPSGATTGSTGLITSGWSTTQFSVYNVNATTDNFSWIAIGTS